jgi:hypothetical protein
MLNNVHDASLLPALPPPAQKDEKSGTPTPPAPSPAGERAGMQAMP